MKFEGKIEYPCYEDENGNIITVIEDPEEENIFLVVRLSKEGDVEHLEGFESAENAEDMLHDFCKNEGYQSVKKQKLGYAFAW